MTAQTRPDTVVDFQAMGSVCRIRLAGTDAATARAWAEQAVAEVRRIEAAWSRYREDSVVARINAAAGSGRWTEVDAETAGLLDFAAQLVAASDGLFDPTSGVLRRAWDFKAARVPASAELAALLPLIGWDGVEREPSPGGARVRLAREGMELDFGGFGKEYAVDRAATLLQQQGATSGLVNLGGDLRVLGPQPDGRPWQLGIAHPRRAGAVVATLPLLHGALATSGDYERWFEQDGRRYCHILQPRTGQPVTHWQSVTVLAPACLAAGALTTIAMLLEDRAAAFLRQQGVDWLAVDAAGQVHRGVPEAA